MRKQITGGLAETLCTEQHNYHGNRADTGRRRITTGTRRRWKSICPLDTTDGARTTVSSHTLPAGLLGPHGQRSARKQAAVPSEAGRLPSRRQILFSLSREIGCGEIGSGVARSSWLTNPALVARPRVAVLFSPSRCNILFRRPHARHAGFDWIVPTYFLRTISLQQFVIECDHWKCLKPSLKLLQWHPDRKSSA